jgi:prevent-host-death family protein
MASIRVSELKAQLSRYLARVRGGEEVVVTDRGRPVARLVPIAEGNIPDAARLAALERAGLARPGRGRLPPDFWRRPRPRDVQGKGPQALLEERDSGR